MPVYVKGITISDDGELVIDADELADAGVSSVELIERAAVIAAEEADRQTAELRKQLAEANARAEAAEKRAQADWQKVQAIEAEFTQQLRGKQAELDKSRELRAKAEAQAEAAEEKREWCKANCDEAIARNDRLLAAAEARAADLAKALEEFGNELNWDLPDFVWISEGSPVEFAQAALNPDAREEGDKE